MKKKLVGAILLLALFTGCAKRNKITKLPSLDHITAVEAKLPLRLSEIDLYPDEGLVLNDGINSRIRKEVEEYYKNECIIDSTYSYKDTYVNTIRFNLKPYTMFLVLVKHYPTENLSGKALFYDDTKKEFLNDVFDFKIYALYDYVNGRLIPSKLKKRLKLDAPEIEAVDYDKNGTDDLKFERLYHNGSYNAIFTTVLNVSNSKIDTLHFEKKVIR